MQGSLLDQNPEAPQALLPLSPTPADLIAQAIEKGLDVESLERLMALYERWQTEQARRAYTEALAKFQSIIPRLPKKKRVKFPSKSGGEVDYFYCPLSDM